jgi:FkbM family methyltransferase
MGVLKKIIRRTVNKFGYDVCRSFRFWVEPPDLLDLAIRSRTHDDFFFVQVGAHDGVSYDPIRMYILEYDWKGILVEPQRGVFDALQENYKDCKNLIFENCAITDADGPVNLYRPKEEREGQSQPDTMATVFPQHFKDNQETETVAGLTLLSLLQKHKVQRLDFLQSDAEGFDDQIVRQALKLPGALKPKLMHFEVGYQPQNKLVSLYSELSRQGYRLSHGRGLPEHDTLAVWQSIPDRNLPARKLKCNNDSK